MAKYHNKRGLHLKGWKDLSPQKSFDLTGLTALVTGAGGGIGRWLAGGLQAAGANVVLSDTNTKTLYEVQQILKNDDTTPAAIAADLSDVGQCIDLVERATANTPSQRLDILVNCAGFNIRTPTLDVTEDQFDQIMGVDLKAPFFVAQAAARHMQEQDGGSIVHIGSINGFQGLPEVGVYGPAKAGLEQLTKVQAIEWADRGIRVNCIAPGFIDTPLTRPLQDDPTRASWITGRVPQARFGHPSELVGVLQFLASSASSFVTGQTFYVDGGFTAGSDWRKGTPG